MLEQRSTQGRVAQGTVTTERGRVAATAVPLYRRTGRRWWRCSSSRRSRTSTTPCRPSSASCCSRRASRSGSASSLGYMASYFIAPPPEAHRAQRRAHRRRRPRCQGARDGGGRDRTAGRHLQRDGRQAARGVRPGGVRARPGGGAAQRPERRRDRPVARTAPSPSPTRRRRSFWTGRAWSARPSTTPCRPTWRNCGATRPGGRRLRHGRVLPRRAPRSRRPRIRWAAPRTSPPSSCSATSPRRRAWSARGATSSPTHRTSSRRPCSRSPARSSSSTRATSAPRNSGSSCKSCGSRSTGCATWRSACSTSRAWRPGSFELDTRERRPRTRGTVGARRVPGTGAVQRRGALVRGRRGPGAATSSAWCRCCER